LPADVVRPSSADVGRILRIMKMGLLATVAIVEIRMKAIGTAHSTRASAETALTADKTCATPLEVSKNERIRL
jgi:hypothetical protein